MLVTSIIFTYEHCSNKQINVSRIHQLVFIEKVLENNNSNIKIEIIYISENIIKNWQQTRLNYRI